MSSSTTLKERITEECRKRLRKKRRWRADERVALLRRVGRHQDAQIIEEAVQEHFNQQRARMATIAEALGEQRTKPILPKPIPEAG